MFAVICVFLLVGIISLGFGAMLLHSLVGVGLIQSNTADKPHAAELLLAGMCVWGSCLNIWSLLGAVDSRAMAISLLVVAVYAARYGRHWADKALLPFYSLFWRDNKRWCIVLLGVCLLLCAVIPPNNYDTGLYHLPAIRWIEQYAVVPGLGNLHGRFAFNPAIFTLSAAINGRDIWGVPAFVLNSVLLFVFLGWLIGEISRSASANKTLLYGIIAAICLVEYVMQVSSPTPDIAGTVLTCFVLLRLWEFQQTSADSTVITDWQNYVLLVVIALYALVTKLSTAPVLLSIPYILWLCRRTLSARLWATAVLLGLLVVAPWLMRNYFLSGYLAYPLPIDLWSPDWKIPLENAIDERNWIYSWARLPNRPWQEVLAMPYSVWLPLWFGQLSFIQQFICIGLFVLSPLVVVLFALLRLNTIRQLVRQPDALRYIRAQWVFVWAIAYCGCIYWFFTAPAFRFGSAFIWLAFLVPILALPLYQFLPIKQNYYRTFALGLICVVMGYFCANATRQLLGYFSWATGAARVQAYAPTDYLFAPLLIEPVGWKANLSYQTHHIGKIIVLTPSGDNRCFDSGLPCTPVLNPTLQLRGSSIDEGFRVSKPHLMQLSDF